MVPVLFCVNTVCALPSPQLTSTEYGPEPLAVKDPRLMDELAPSTAVCGLAGGVTVGGAAMMVRFRSVPGPTPGEPLSDFALNLPLAVPSVAFAGTVIVTVQLW